MHDKFSRRQKRELFSNLKFEFSLIGILCVTSELVVTGSTYIYCLQLPTVRISQSFVQLSIICSERENTLLTKHCRSENTVK